MVVYGPAPQADSMPGHIDPILMTSFTTRKLAAGAALAAFSMMVILSVAPPPSPSQAAVLRAYETSHAQKLTVSDAVPAADVTRDKYSATPAIETYVNRGTNFDWATLVLVDGKWPVTPTSVAVITRWMRQENGPNNWWNRNNPLNNGYGSGGMAGTGSYANLTIAAQKAAENLHHNPGFAAIASGFASGASADVIQHAIFASPWSTSHYANGTHWSMTPVPSFKAPASAW
jgi:hypothetical protein